MTNQFTITSHRNDPGISLRHIRKNELNHLDETIQGSAFTGVSTPTCILSFVFNYFPTPGRHDLALFLEQRTCTFISIGDRLKKEGGKRWKKEKGRKRKTRKRGRERGRQKTREIASQGISFEHKRNRNRRCRDINR